MKNNLQYIKLPYSYTDSWKIGVDSNNQKYLTYYTQENELKIVPLVVKETDKVEVVGAIIFDQNGSYQKYELEELHILKNIIKSDWNLIDCEQKEEEFFKYCVEECIKYNVTSPNVIILKIN